MTWDDYVGQWFKHINILERMGEPFSPYLHMFLFSVKDPRLEAAINTIQHPDTYKKETFESAQMYLTNALQIQSNNNTAGNKSRRRSVSSTTQGGDNDTQYLPPDVWKKMTRDERSAHIAKNRKARATKRNREVQAANTENNTDNATDAETGTTSNTESNAGSQFGSNAYANKRQKAS